MQVLLLGVGVALLATAATFFMIFAFVAFGIVVRAIIIGAVTAATIAGATMLRRRRLFGTAEAVATLGIVLLLLDAWALRANGLFGLNLVDESSYWGFTLIIVAVGLCLWQHYSALRAPGIAGASLLPVGAGLLAFGVSAAADSSDAGFFAALAVCASTLLHPVFVTRSAAPRDGGGGDGGGGVGAGLGGDGVGGGLGLGVATVQRVILLGWAAVGVFMGLVSVVSLAPAFVGGISLGLLGLAAVALAHAVVLGRFGTPSLWTTRLVAGAGALSAVLVALAPAALALRSDESVVAIAVPALGAAAVALALEAALKRAPAGSQPAMSLGIMCTAVVASAFALIPLAVATLSMLEVLSASFERTRELSFGAVIRPLSVESTTAVITLAILAAAMWMLWLFLQGKKARAPLVASSALLVVVLAIPLLTLFGLIVAGWLLSSAVGVGWMLWRLANVDSSSTSTRTTDIGAGTLPTLRQVVGQFTAATAALAYVLSWAGQHTWWAVSLIGIALLLVARRVFPQPSIVPRAVLLAAAVAVAFVGVAGLGGLGSGTSVLSSTSDFALRDAATGLLVFAVLLIVTATVPLAGVLSDLDRRTLFWPSAVVAATSVFTLIVVVPLRVSPAWLLLVLGVLLVAALVIWSIAPTTRAFVVERIVAAVAVAPAVSWMLQSFARVLGLDELLGGSVVPAGFVEVAGFSGGGVVGATAALLVSAAALAATLRSAPVVARSFTDIGIGLVLVVAVVEVAAHGGSLGWLTLLIAAFAVLLQSISGDGLFASASPRRLVGWLAFGLAASALWLRLFDADVTVIEPFTVPVAAGLLVIAGLIERVEHRRGLRSAVAPALVLAGALLALVPSALQATSGPPLRAVLVVAIGAVILLVCRWLRLSDRLRPFALVIAAAGAVGVAVASLGRAVVASLDPSRAPTEEPIDLWIVIGCAILFVAGLAFLRTRHEQRGEASLTIALLVAAGTGLLGAEALRITAEPGAAVRAIALVIVFAVLHVAASIAARLPAQQLLSWLPLGYAVLAALLGLHAELIEPVEVATLPIALALLASGAWRMIKIPAMRSMPALGPGLLVLLVPSLLMTAVDRELWRIVLIGVVAILVIVIGVILRLQAPFAIGSVVVLIHAMGTFSPQIRYIYEATPWWLWVAIGGGLLLFLGATYERRARDLRRTVGRITSLR